MHTGEPPVVALPRSTTKRSIIKAITYRVVVICLDFIAIYWMTGKVSVAFGFMLVSNLYTTAAYFLHERLWARIAWGRAPSPSNSAQLRSKDEGAIH